MATPAGELDALLDRIPVLQGVQRRVTSLDGGLTNENLRVTTPDRDLVVRILRGDAALLGIDRDAEHLNSLAAAAAGVGAPVVDYRPDLGVLVLGFLQGLTLENASFADPDVLARAADAVRRLHAGSRFTGDFDMFGRQAGYRKTVADRGYRLFEGYDAHADDWQRVRAALAVRAGPTVPCNNDLLAGNFVDDGDLCWLIDYEYSGNNDAYFELGNTATECDLDNDQVAALVRGYCGRDAPALVARVHLQSLVSEYGWSLWGAIQAAASPLDFDFFGWGQERFDKAAARFNSPAFDRMLDDAAGDPG